MTLPPLSFQTVLIAEPDSRGMLVAAMAGVQSLVVVFTERVFTVLWSEGGSKIAS